MSILSLYDITMDVGGNRLLDSVTWHIQPGDRIVLVGRNGAGKSSLLRLLQGELSPDRGEIKKQQNLRIAGLVQEVPSNAINETVYHFLVQGLGEIGAVLAQWKDLQEIDDPDAHIACQQKIDQYQAWPLLHQIETMASRLDVPSTEYMKNLSGGMKRRVLLAAALIAEPDLLLLDEPTNHLDLEAIEWLESLVKSWKGSVVVVTHDREFASQISNKIVQIDRGKLYSHDCDFDTWIARREAMEEEENRHNALFDKKLAQEEVWIRTGIRARRTRNEGRVRALEAMRRAHQERRAQMGKVQSSGVNVSHPSGMLVMEATHVNFAIEGKAIIRDFSLLVTRGDKLGIIGPNGCGKTTLIRLLTGDLKPDSGKIRRGTNLEIAFFDQLRSQLNESETLMEAVAEGSDYVTINGKDKHVASYLREFLFPPERFNQQVSTLSGGERNRLLLAKLLAKPVNLLVMDEPTNDLDMETLELLETLLMDYSGTLLLISHDRQFIDAVVTSVLVYTGNGTFEEFAGGYKEYAVARKKQEKQATVAVTTAPVKPASADKKLSYQEKRELAELPQKIEKLEAKIATQHAAMADPAFYQQSPEALAKLNQQLQADEKSLAEMYSRWELLEEK